MTEDMWLYERVPINKKQMALLNFVNWTKRKRSVGRKKAKEEESIKIHTNAIGTQERKKIITPIRLKGSVTYFFPSYLSA